MTLDLLLVVGYFRSATPFLSLVRHLSGRHRVGVLFADLDGSLQAKTGEAHETFRRLCANFGAQLVPLGAAVSTRLMLVQQFPYDDAVVQRIRGGVRAQETHGVLTLASAGLERHDAFVRQFSIRELYAPDAGLIRFLLDRRGAAERYRDTRITEVGLPFHAHPVFPEFRVDWLLAAPTLFSFHNEAGKQHFLRTVLALMARIPSSQHIAYKPHNGNANDYFTPTGYYAVARLLVGLPGALRILEALARLGPPALGKLLTSVLHLRVLRRAAPMRRLTPYADLSIEAFLPGVAQGVIGGLSNVIWGTRWFGLPFCNCVAPQARSGQTQYKPGADALLDTNLEYFGVAFCEGKVPPPQPLESGSAGTVRDLVDCVDALLTRSSSAKEATRCS